MNSENFAITEEEAKIIFRAKEGYKPIWQLAAENNKKAKIVTVRRSKDDRRFMGVW